MSLLLDRLASVLHCALACALAKVSLLAGWCASSILGLDSWAVGGCVRAQTLPWMDHSLTQRQKSSSCRAVVTCGPVSAMDPSSGLELYPRLCSIAQGNDVMG